MTRKFFVFLLIIFYFFEFNGASAQISAADIHSQINLLLNKIGELQKQIAELSGESASPAQKSEFFLNQFRQFSENFGYGKAGDLGVKKLQEFLIRKKYLAEGFNTGNYFRLTVEAVKKFQKDNGIVQTGFFGPLTRSVVNNELKKEEESAKYKLWPKPVYQAELVEGLVYEMINRERIDNGIPKLFFNDAAAETAKLHSKEQAGDNNLLTVSNVVCSYPLIRHEGFTFGFNVGDRLANRGIFYKLAGENIVILPLSKNLIYRAKESAAACRDFDKKPEFSESGDIEEARYAIEAEIQKRENWIIEQESVEWVNREWLTSEEAAEKAVKNWMNSEGHRKNILNAEFKETGIGVAEINDYVIITQVFVKK